MSRLSEPSLNAGSVSSRAWLVWGLAAAFFFCDYVARVSLGVMVSDLGAEFNISATRLSAISIYFYLPYVLMQIPVGILVDRYGVRYLLISMSLLTGMACALFGFAEQVWVIELARFLLGFGAAFAFVSALKLAAEWFPSSWLGSLAGMTQALGMIGAAFGGYPIVISMAAVGWRYTMIGLAVIFAVLCVCIAQIVYDRPGQADDEASPSLRIRQQLWMVLSHRQTWINAMYAGLLYAPVGALAEFWGPSYLEHVRHMPPNAAAWVNSMIFVGWGVGGPVMGWLSDSMHKRKPVMLLSALAGLVILSMVLYLPGLSTLSVLILLFLFGVSNNGVAIAYAVASELVPRRVSGTAIAFANMMSVIIGTVLLFAIGWLLDYLQGQVIVDGQVKFMSEPFQLVMLCLPICLLLSVLLVLGLRETHCAAYAGD